MTPVSRKPSVGYPTEGRRIYQCPGCWSFDVMPQPPDGGWMECDCGERMTLIDLRARTLEGPHAKHWHEDEH